MGEKTKVKALCVATRCQTVEQFVATFHRFSDEDSFFVATLNSRPIGLETAFAIQLANREPVLRGTCVVREAWTTSDNPYKRPGIRLGIKRLTPDSELVFAQLKEARKVMPPEPIEEADALSETPVPIAMPKQLTLPRTSTSTRKSVATPTVPTIVVPPKAPPEAKVLEIVMPEQRDQRTPGSELILPANPLMNLTDDALVGFVDCTLYEETANFLAADDNSDIGDLIGPPIMATEEPVLKPTPLLQRPSMQLRAETIDAEPLPRSETSVSQLLPVHEASVSQLMPRTITGTQRAEASVSQQLPRITGAQRAEVSVSQLMPRTITGTQRDGSQVAMLEPSQVTLLERSQMTAIPPPIPEPSYHNDPQRLTPVPAGEQFTQRVRMPTARRGNKRWMVIGGVGTAASLGLVALLVTRSSASSDDVTPPPPIKPTAPVVATPPPKAVEVTPPKPEATPAPDPTPVEPNYPSVIGDGPCKLEVTSTPAGSMIAIDDRTVGPSPITVAGSCDRHKVDITHPRYKAEQRFVVTETNKANSVDVTLVRPTHQLWVFTNPPGATVYLAGRSAGTSPTILSVMGFSGIDVKVELPGYAPVTKRVYSKVADDKVYLNLTRNPAKKR